MVAKNKGLSGLATKSKVNKVGNNIAFTIEIKMVRCAYLMKGEEVKGLS